MIVKRPEKKEKKHYSRYTAFVIIMIISFTMITGKLVYLQIYKKDDYQDKANTTATKFVSESAPRGNIYDQNGNVLATNTQTYSITYTSTTEADRDFYSTVDKLTDIFDESSETFQDDLILKLDDNNKWYFEYKNSDTATRKNEEIRFKRDRGLNEDVQKEVLGKTDDDSDISEEDTKKVNEKLLEITPEEVYYYLVKSYNLIDLVDPEPVDDGTKEYEAKKKEYDTRKNKYKDMSGEELANIISEKYDYKEMRKYLVVKDALKIQSLKGYKSVTIASNIKRDTSFVIYQKLNELPGIDVVLSPTRNYPYNTLAASVIGYLSKINESKKETYEMKGYDASTDLVGVSGIEAAFEEELKGVKGGTTVKVNPKGRVTQELFKLESYPGNNVHLTIDKNIQAATENALVGAMNDIQKGGEYPNANRGAAVAVEVNTGRILASVSYPTYDPNDFAISGTLSNDKIKEYFAPDLEEFGNNYIASNHLNLQLDDLFPLSSSGERNDKRDIYPKPLYNYATQGLIPAGSTFKPMTGIAALEEGVISPNETVFCSKVFNIHPDIFGKGFDSKCLGYHGSIDMKTALEESCNFYFYEMGTRLYEKNGGNIEGLNALAKYAWKFGLGVDPDSQQRASTGIEIDENFGQVYNFKSWRNQTAAMARININNILLSGSHKSYSFIPFDFADSEDDSEELRLAKKSLKDKIAQRYESVGASDEVKSSDAFAKTILSDVKDIIKYSSKYETNVKAYEEARGVTVNTDTEATKVANVIADYIVNDQRGEIITPAQEIFASIGQGMDNFTPMQLAQYVSTLANGGTRYKLHFVDKITDADGNVVQEYKPEVLDKIDLKPSTVETIKEGMAKVNNEDGGTARTAWIGFPIQTGGKTGTADVHEDQAEWGRAPYATYVSFAPLDNPQIAFVGVVYDGGHGGSIASVARTAFEAYFKDQLLQDDPNYAEKSETFKNYVMTVPEDNK